MPSPSRPARFATTHWSVVIAAGGTDSSQAERALATLCEDYWYPLYAFVRRQGHSPDRAQDLTQAFFARFLEKHDVRQARPERGRFRSFLLASLKHFLANQADFAHALKRGGSQPVLPLEFEDAERRYSVEPVENVTPEHVFERRWALTVLDRALIGVRQRWIGAGKGDLFDRLKGCLTVDPSTPSYQAIAAEFDMTDGAVKVTVHRLRRQFQDVLRSEIAKTVEFPTDVDDEIQFLLAALGGRASRQW